METEAVGKGAGSKPIRSGRPLVVAYRSPGNAVVVLRRFFEEVGTVHSLMVPRRVEVWPARRLRAWSVQGGRMVAWTFWEIEVRSSRVFSLKVWPSLRVRSVLAFVVVMREVMVWKAIWLVSMLI